MKLYSPYFDIMIAAYLINPNRGKYNFNEITLEFLGKLYDSLESSNLIMFELYEKLHREMKEKELERLYFDIEMPLIDVLFEMEEAGIKLILTNLRLSQNRYLLSLTNSEKKFMDSLELSLTLTLQNSFQRFYMINSDLNPEKEVKRHVQPRWRFLKNFLYSMNYHKK